MEIEPIPLSVGPGSVDRDSSPYSQSIVFAFNS